MRFSCEKISAPFGVPVKTSRGTFPQRESFVVRLENSDGDFACGECAPWLGFGCETLAEAEDFLCRLDGNVPAAIPETLPCVTHAFFAAKFFLENPSLRASLALPENALRAKLIRRSREDSVEKLLDEIARFREAGFSVFKLKIGLGEPADELCFCEKILSAVPEGTKIRFDANGAFEENILPALARLSEADAAEFFEQPLATSAENDARVFALAEKTAAKFALDESVREPWAFPRETRVVAVVKPLLVADFPRLLAWLEAPRGADVVISTIFENSPAGTLALRLACARLAASRRRPFGLG